MQETLPEDENVVAEAEDGTRLIKTDDNSGVVIEVYDDPDEENGLGENRVEYENYKNAKLHFGLWKRVGGITGLRPDRSASKFVPLEVVALGQPAVVAWVRTGGGRGVSTPADTIGGNLGIATGPVNNYMSEARGWADE